MTDNHIAADLTEKLGIDAKPGLMGVALRPLATGEPVTPAELAAAAGVSHAEVEHATAGRDIEYDDHGRIVGWGLTRNPTPHRFTVPGRQLYTWCAPDTLIFPAVIGQVADVESPCPATATTIRLTVDPPPASPHCTPRQRWCRSWIPPRWTPTRYAQPCPTRSTSSPAPTRPATGNPATRA